MELPNFRTDANHLIGCMGMDEETLREEMKVYLEKAYLRGVLDERKVQDKEDK